MIRTVFLDAGNTLLRAYPSVADIYAEVSRRHGSAATREEIEGAMRQVWQEATRLRGGPPRDPSGGIAGERGWWREIVRRVFEQAGPVEDFETFFDELYDLFARPATWRVYPDVLPALERLQGAGYRMAVISNWDSRLERILEDLGLAPFFPWRIISSQVGFEKPQPGIFRLALERLGARPDESLHVGDDPTLDFHAARAVGMAAVLLDREGKWGGLRPRITGLQELHPAQLPSS